MSTTEAREASSNAAGEALAMLRASTREAHVRLEQRLALTKPSRTTHDHYGRYLARMFSVVRKVEPALLEDWALCAQLPDLELRTRKARLIATDLEDLGIDARQLPAMSPCPDLLETAHRWGALYVLEGSTLGGAIVAREFEAALGPIPKRYLRCYGDALGVQWRRFCAALETALPRDALRQQAAASALQTFERIELWFDAGGLLEPRAREVLLSSTQ